MEKKVETTAEIKEPIYGKRQLKEHFKPDAVEVLFKDNEAVTLAEAEKRINKFYKTKL